MADEFNILKLKRVFVLSTHCYIMIIAISLGQCVNDLNINKLVLLINLIVFLLSIILTSSFIVIVNYSQ